MIANRLKQRLKTGVSPRKKKALLLNAGFRKMTAEEQLADASPPGVAILAAV